MLVSLWIGAGIILFWYIARYRDASSGIAMAYFADLSMIHLTGGMIYALPWYAPQSAYLLSQGNSLLTVKEGFLQSVIGLWAFLAGLLIVSPLLGKFFGVKNVIQQQFLPHRKLPITYLKAALIINFIVAPIFKYVPSFSSFFNMGWQLIIVSVSLLIWQSFLEGRKDRVSGWLQKAGFFLPILTIMMDGFLGFGIRAFIAIFIFYLCVFRIRKATFVKLILMAYFGLSLFISYMEQRDAIREVLWYRSQAATTSQKVGAVSKIFTEFTFFNPRNNEHLEHIDGRLNQNVLVGQAVTFLHQRNHSFANGETIRDAFIALVPRILWPGKPMKGGSGSIVSDYTGQEYPPGTSVGVGQVLEFYINFGTSGVVFGFLIFGGILGLIDRMAILKLKQGNWQGFAFWFLPGTAMMQSGGSLAEIVMSSAAGFVFILVLNKTVLARFISKPMAEEDRS